MRLTELGPGWATDFFLHRHGAIVIERDDCIVVRTPDNPNFYWGNFLLLPEVPADGELALWLRRFGDEIASLQTGSEHVAIGINEPPARFELPSWTAAGLQRHASAVLRLDAGTPRASVPAPRGEARFAVLDLERDAEAIVELDCADTHGFEPRAYADYRRRQLRRYAQMAGEGAAAWFGLWSDGILVAECGLMRAGAAGRIGRFQHVMTHPKYRRRGLCTALIDTVSTWGFQQWRLESAVMCADPDDVAIGIYHSLGYRRMAHECGLQRNAPRDRVPEVKA
jgi:GNAT superfamily N-acetyltransferase